MSRTFKDKPPRIRFPETSGGIRYTCNRPDKNSKKLKRKEVDCENHWISCTPSWWNRLYHTRPKRLAGHMWEQEVVKAQSLDAIEELDIPSVDNKPHKYYY